MKEDDDRQNQQGLLLSKGWMPGKFRSPVSRYKMENVSEQTFLGFVSQLPELQNNSFIHGNARQYGRLKYTCADMNDFTDSTGFVNKK